MHLYGTYSAYIVIIMYSQYTSVYTYVHDPAISELSPMHAYGMLQNCRQRKSHSKITSMGLTMEKYFCNYAYNYCTYYGAHT